MEETTEEYCGRVMAIARGFGLQARINEIGGSFSITFVDRFSGMAVSGATLKDKKEACLSACRQLEDWWQVANK